MPSLYQLKPRFQQLLRPLLHGLHRLGISANAVTIFALLASVSLGALLWCWPQQRTLWLVVPVFMLVRMALNAIDGMLAREFNQQSRLGAILNEVGDVVADAALFAPFALLPGVSPALLVLVIFLATLTEFVGVLGQVIGGDRRYDGPSGKSDRALVFGTLAALHGLGWLAQAVWLPVLALMAVLLALTVVNRARAALRAADSAALGAAPGAERGAGSDA